MGLYERIPSDSAVADDMASMRQLQRRGVDSTSGQLFNVQETLAAIIAELRRQQKQLADQQEAQQRTLDFLLGQTAYGQQQALSRVDGAGDRWEPFDAAYDAQVTFTTSSTGWVSALFGGVGQGAFVDGSAVATVGLELDGVIYDGSGQWTAGNLLGAAGATLSATTAAGGAVATLVQLQPGRTYTARTRRYGLRTGDGSSSSWWNLWVQVTKVGI